ncbi:MAG: hypothetical protein Tsb0015_06730 [Simkaniaceae bacterium]
MNVASPISMMPDEIVMRVFSSLPDKDLARMALVSKQFKKISEDNVLWEPRVKAKFKILDDKLEKNEAWKQRYTALWKEKHQKPKKPGRVKTMTKKVKHEMHILGFMMKTGRRPPCGHH